jgi:hypothetical protein
MNQLGVQEYARERKFRERINAWLKLITLYWPECPAVIAKNGSATGSVGPADEQDRFTEESLAAESDAQIEAATTQSVAPVKDLSNRCSSAKSNCWIKCPWWLRSPVSCAMNEYRS